MSNSCSNGAAIQSYALSQSCSGASSRHHLGYKLLVHNSLCMSRSSTCVWLKHYSHRRLVENALSLDDCKSMAVGSEVLPITLAHRLAMHTHLFNQTLFIPRFIFNEHFLAPSFVTLTIEVDWLNDTSTQSMRWMQQHATVTHWATLCTHRQFGEFWTHGFWDTLACR